MLPPSLCLWILYSLARSVARSLGRSFGRSPLLYCSLRKALGQTRLFLIEGCTVCALERGKKKLRETREELRRDTGTSTSLSTPPSTPPRSAHLVHRHNDSHWIHSPDAGQSYTTRVPTQLPWGIRLALFFPFFFILLHLLFRQKKKNLSLVSGIIGNGFLLPLLFFVF